MKKNNLKIKSEKGITLIALIITVVIMLILAAVSINVGLDSLKSTELEGFYTELGIIQKKVDYIASTNENYSTLGAALNSTQKNKLNIILGKEASDLNVQATDFRYFTVNEIKSVLGLENIKYDVFIAFKTRTVVAEKGVTIDGDTYHMLPDRVYNVSLNTVKDEKIAVDILEHNVQEYGKVYYPTIQNALGSNKNVIGNTLVYVGKTQFLVTVTPKNGSGEKMTGGVLKYKKTNSNYWNTAEDFKFIVTEAGQYDISYEDANQNKKTTKIIVNGS